VISAEAGEHALQGRAIDFERVQIRMIDVVFGEEAECFLEAALVEGIDEATENLRFVGRWRGRRDIRRFDTIDRESQSR
jgi:hypothetical protein